MNDGHPYNKQLITCFFIHQNICFHQKKEEEKLYVSTTAEAVSPLLPHTFVATVFVKQHISNCTDSKTFSNTHWKSPLLHTVHAVHIRVPQNFLYLIWLTSEEKKGGDFNFWNGKLCGSSKQGGSMLLSLLVVPVLLWHCSGGGRLVYMGGSWGSHGLAAASDPRWLTSSSPLPPSFPP